MSEDLYEKNLAVLRECHPELAKIVADTRHLPALSLASLPKGRQDIQLHFNDGTQRLLYQGEAQRYSQDIIDRLQLKNPRLLFFLGLGLGHHLLRYLQKPHSLNQAVMVIEPYPQIFMMALRVVDLTPLFRHQKIFWFVGREVLDLKKFLGDFFRQGHWIRYANAIEYIPLPCVVEMVPRFFADVEREVARAIGHGFNLFVADPYDAYRGIENILRNLPAMMAMSPLDQLQGAFAGIPGIVVAAGPSLTESLPFLKKIQNHAVIAACPSALSVLQSQGINAHLWIHIERGEEQAQIFSAVTRNDGHVFVAPPIVYPDCFNVHGGKNTFIKPIVFSSWLPLEGEILRFGHSSAHAAFASLSRLGCDPLYLVGQDLSYDENASHVTGAADESTNLMKQLKDENRQIFEVEGNDGKPVSLNVFWHTYLKSLSEEMIPSHQGSVYNVIAKNKGVKIHGAERIDPSSLPSRVGTREIDVFQVLAERLVCPTADKTKDLQERATAHLHQTIAVLERVMQDSEQFALRVKEFQFQIAPLRNNWRDLENPFKDFINTAEKFFARFSEDPHYQQDRACYESFFFVIVQGFTIRCFIDYFTSAAEWEGNFSEINRKLELIFHMAKDHSFWARTVMRLLQDSLKKFY